MMMEGNQAISERPPMIRSAAFPLSETSFGNCLARQIGRPLYVAVHSLPVNEPHDRWIKPVAEAADLAIGLWLFRHPLERKLDTGIAYRFDLQHIPLDLVFPLDGLAH